MTAGLRPWERALLESVHAQVGSVLVIGCGTGREAFALEGHGWTVTAIDVTPALLAIAREEATRRASSTRFELIDGARVPIADATVTAVTLWSQVLNNVPTRAGRLALLREAHRVLVPGGVVSFSVHDRDRTLPRLSPDQIVSVDEPEPGDLVLIEQEGGVRRLNHYFDDDEVQRLCSDAGFDVPRVWHSSDLGEAWDNLFVVAATKRNKP
ncbi:MAG: class I SAM-dependent methyltransferase [Microbacteriaceae bacterium]